jgi:hypothetical protein
MHRGTDYLMGQQMPGVTANLPNGSADYLDPDGWLKHFV